MAKFGRVYRDEVEKAQRFEIFKKNMKYIEDFNNAGGNNYTLREGPFTNLTTEELLTTDTGGSKVQEAEFRGSLCISLSLFRQTYIEAPLCYMSTTSNKDNI